MEDLPKIFTTRTSINFHCREAIRAKAAAPAIEVGTYRLTLLLDDRRARVVRSLFIVEHVAVSAARAEPTDFCKRQ